MSPALLLRSCIVTAALSAGLFAQTPATPAPKPAATPPKPKPTPPPVLDRLGIKLIPQPGVKIADADRAELTAGVAALGREIETLRGKTGVAEVQLALLPDVEIFHKAVDWALRYDEFFQPKQVEIARRFLALGMARAKELQDAKPSWELISGTDTTPTADGKDKLPAMLVRGYRSKIDGSIQPYGLVLPADYKPGEKTPRRLDIWCHGRGETLSELDFMNQRLTNKGEFTPPGAIVLHLYGRYCCANKFAGEVDLFEALDNARTHYKIDDHKLVIRGFSMGGAAVWQFGTHFADKFAVVQPGAGFAETREFNKVYAEGKTAPTWWEEVLYRWYDATDSVANLANTTTVAYSGELDGQKQAADIMIRYARKEGSAGATPAGSGAPAGTIPPTGGASSAVSNDGPRPGSSAGAPKTTAGAAALPGVAPGDGSPKADEARVAGTAKDVEFHHVIGPQTPHKIKPEAKPEIEKLIDAGLARHKTLPTKIRFTTYSLIYPQMEWIRIVGMEKQWERADVKAEWTITGITAKTKNVSAIEVLFPFVSFVHGTANFTVDGATFPLQWVHSEVPRWMASAHKKDGKWIGGIEKPRDNAALAKTPGLCGPIDHAFMSSFVFVRPTGKPLNDKIGAWATGELDHAIGFWRKVFRGEAPVKADTAISDDDIKNSNLVLWGDPSSNAVLKKIIDRLPLRWTAQELALLEDQPRTATDKHGQAAVTNQPGKVAAVRDPSVSVRGSKIAGQTYDAAHVAPVLIFPNPLNPAKYVVLNSGPTFREDALLNNSQQIPKLPDWAIIDVRTPPDGKWPGLVLEAGFFDEQWRVPGK